MSRLIEQESPSFSSAYLNLVLSALVYLACTSTVLLLSYSVATSASHALYLPLSPRSIWNEKQWTTQTLMLAQQAADPDLVLQPDIWTTNRGLAAHIPVFALLNPGNATVTCASMRWAPDSEQCRYQAAVNGYCLDFMRETTTMTAGSQLFTCDSCSQSEWLGSGSTIPWVASTVLAAISGLNASETRSFVGAS
jgi:hypothetical protein